MSRSNKRRPETARAKRLRYMALHGAERNARRRVNYAQRRGEYAWLPAEITREVRWVDVFGQEDILQERALAVLEGRDPERAERRWRHLETTWRMMTLPLPIRNENGLLVSASFKTSSREIREMRATFY
jgi:hypothetical protein